MLLSLCHRLTTACNELFGMYYFTVKSVHAVTSIATVITLPASAAAACLQISTYHIQSCNHIDSVIPQ